MDPKRLVQKKLDQPIVRDPSLRLLMTMIMKNG